MSRATTLTRLERLELLTSRLKSDEPMILREIADELGVSLRSIGRDIQILRERGLPIEADRGRGGGVRLNPSWGVGRIALTHGEAINLLISIAVTNKMEASILMGNLSPVQRKLTASFSKENQRKIKRLRDRIRIGPSSSSNVLLTYKAASKDINDKMQESFLLMRRAIIKYRSGKGEMTKRTIEPHYLVLGYPVWYALCWDELRNERRTFRLDRVSEIEVTDDDFVLRPYTEFEDIMRGVDVIVP